MTIFGDVFIGNGFRQICKYWHFRNNEDHRDRLDKIKTLFAKSLYKAYAKLLKPREREREREKKKKRKEKKLQNGHKRVVSWRKRGFPAVL